MFLEAQAIDLDVGEVKEAVETVVGEDAADAAAKAAKSTIAFVDKYPWLKPAITVLVTLLVAKIILTLVNRTIRRANVEKTTQNYLYTVFRVIIYGAAVLVIAGTFGFNVTSLVALFSVVGAAFALAAQGTLANFFAGILLLVSKPLKMGEYVVLGGPGVEGIVQGISIMNTRLTTPDNRLVVVPNSSIVAGTVTNCSRCGTRRIDLNFSISYDADIDLTKEVILGTLKSNPMVLYEPEPPFARITGFGESSVTYTARFWADGANYWHVQFDLLETIKKNLDAAGIEIPYHHLNVHLDGGLSQRLR